MHQRVLLPKRYFSGALFGLAFLSLLASCRSSSLSTAEQNEIRERAALVRYAEKQMGTPYRYGGITSKGFDCSGFVSYVYSKFGYKLARSSSAMMKTGKRVSEKEALPGDLIFFKGRDPNSKTAGHVGIVTEVRPSGEVLFIHAATSHGVRVDSHRQQYYRSRFLQIKRMIGNL